MLFFSRNLELSGRIWLSRWDSNRDWRWSRHWRILQNGTWWVFWEMACDLLSPSFLTLLPTQIPAWQTEDDLKQENQEVSHYDIFEFVKFIVFILLIGTNHCDRNFLYHWWARRTLCSFQGEFQRKFMYIQGKKEFTLIIQLVLDFSVKLWRDSLSVNMHK